MMYPRLKLARNLLTDNGVIFISMDENEIHNLRKLCDEIFGEENYLGDIIRKTKSITSAANNGINIQHEYVCIYCKKFVILCGEKKSFSDFSNEDNDPNGEWKSIDPTAPRDGDTYPIINPYTGKKDVPPKGRAWFFAKEKLEEYIYNGRIKFKKEHLNNERGFIFKRYKKELKSEYNYVNTLFATENNYLNQVATKDIIEMFKNKMFDFTKPEVFIRKLIQYADLKKEDIILDFFSGSATTAHAVMQLNAEDGGNRKYIMVQLPEVCDEKSEAYKAGYKNICEIGKERIRRAGEKIKADESLPVENREKLDIGFKVFKLDSSNIKEWDSETENLEQSLFDSIDNIKSDRTSLDVLYEILLKYGLELTVSIIEKKNFYSIGGGTLLVNLDKEINMEVIDSICEEYKNLLEIDEEFKTTVVLRDSSFKNDVDKTNAMKKLEQVGIKEIRSI